MTLDWANFTPWSSLTGGILMGIAAAVFILFNGRIAGISGILGGLVRPKKGEPVRLGAVSQDQGSRQDAHAVDLHGATPAFIHISDGKMGDVNVLGFLPVEPGAFYVMDRGYLDFSRLYKLHQAGAFFVTRAKSNMNARRVYSAATDRDRGVICDQSIAMNGFYVAKDYPENGPCKYSSRYSPAWSLASE